MRVGLDRYFTELGCVLEYNRRDVPSDYPVERDDAAISGVRHSDRVGAITLAAKCKVIGRRWPVSKWGLGRVRCLLSAVVRLGQT